MTMTTKMMCSCTFEIRDTHVTLNCRYKDHACLPRELSFNIHI